jgi:hypothetical protein
VPLLPFALPHLPPNHFLSSLEILRDRPFLRLSLAFPHRFLFSPAFLSSRDTSLSHCVSLFCGFLSFRSNRYFWSLLAETLLSWFCFFIYMHLSSLFFTFNSMSLPVLQPFFLSLPFPCFCDSVHTLMPLASPHPTQ